jgi:hypothetical protein
MADIFMSYTEKDRDAVSRLADMLKSVGWSVWWDRRIPAGQTWRSVLDKELKGMRCMVVLWSTHSVESEWVSEEAAEGRNLGRLVPVSIERVRPPAGFREIQAADLVDWDGSRDFIGLQRLIEDLERMIGKPGATLPQATASTLQPDELPPYIDPVDSDVPPYGGSQPFATKARRLLPWGAAVLVVSVAAGAYWGASQRRVMPTPAVALPAALPAASAAKPATAAAVAPVPRGDPVKPPEKQAQVSVKKPPLKTSALDARCAVLTERVALGEALSSESQLFLRKECEP